MDQVRANLNSNRDEILQNTDVSRPEALRAG